MNKFREILNYLFNSKNYMSLLIFILTFILAFYASVNIIVPMINGPDGISSLRDKLATNENTLVGLEQKKKAKELEEKRSKVKFDKVPVVIYKSTKPGLSVESASIDFVTTVMNMLSQTDNSLLDISYKIDNLSNAEKISMPSTVSVVQLVMTLNGTYSSFQDFINTLYNYNYVTSLKSIKVVPLKENKNILEINVVLWLYISR